MLSVLDGAVLVISAVEGVQAQTSVLMRTLHRLRIPVLIFVNKIDRGGADCERVLRDISRRLTPAIAAMGSVQGAGTHGASCPPYGAGDRALTTRLADVLTHHDDGLLAAFVDDESAVSYSQLRGALAAQVRRGQVHPVFFGSAITGAGIGSLISGIRELLPAARGDAGGPVSGTVFKVERGPAGEKIAYVRMFSGTLRARDTLPFGRDGARDGRAGERRAGPGGSGKVTAISVFDRGPAVRRESVTAGQIGKLWGLAGIRVGDTLGAARPAGPSRFFAAPTLETVVAPGRPADRGALHAALAQLAEQDPLINLRRDDARQEILVSLYGEVQKEVIQATLADDFGLAAQFRESTTICVERPAGTGASAEFMDSGRHPFRASVGLRLEPAAIDSGVRFGLEVELGSMPFSFLKAVEETVYQTLRQGLYGWQVTDCTVTMTHSAYTPPPPFGWSKWSSAAGDFRNLTPLVLMSALKQAGTRVYEPLHRFRLEIPADTLGPVMGVLARLRGVPRGSSVRDSFCLVEGEVPAAQVHALQLELPALTRGEGVLECAFGCYQPVAGPIPVRPRSGRNPLNRQEYLLQVSRGAAGRWGPAPICPEFPAVGRTQGVPGGHRGTGTGQGKPGCRRAAGRQRGRMLWPQRSAPPADGR